MNFEIETIIELLHIINSTHSLRELMKKIIELIRNKTGCEAVGIRLREGEDFPYYETIGFPDDFILRENKLCARDQKAELIRDSNGNPFVECMCGNVLCNRFNPSKPFFTERGSFWTNSTTELLATATEIDRQARTRNRCHGEGYESVALIALRVRNETFGLLQFNDRRKNLFTPAMIASFEQLADNIALALMQLRSSDAATKSSQIYRSLFETANDSIFVVDCQSLRVVDANKAASELYGYTHNEFLQLSIIDISAELIRSKLSIKNGDCRISLRFHKKKNGTIFPVEITGGYFEQDGMRFQVAFIRDITEQKLTEEMLLNTQERFALSVNAGRIGLFEWNILTDETFWTLQHEIIFGYLPTATTTTTTAHTYEDFAQRVHPDDLAAVEEKIRRAKAEHTVYEAEYRVIWPDGSIHWIYGRGQYYYDSKGEAVRMLGAVVDITDHKMAEKELAESEERYRNLFESMNEGFALCEMIYDQTGKPVDFRYLNGNTAFARISGLPVERVLGRTIKEILPAIEPFRIEAYSHVIETGQGERFYNEVKELGKHFEVYAWRAGVRRFAAVFHDITRRAVFQNKVSLLTNRERQVMELIIAGKSDKQIAAELGVTQRAISFHRTHILKKIQVSSTVELAELAIKST